MRQLFPATPAELATDPLGPSGAEYTCVPLWSRIVSSVVPAVMALEWLMFAVASEFSQTYSWDQVTPVRPVVWNSKLSAMLVISGWNGASGSSPHAMVTRRDRLARAVAVRRAAVRIELPPRQWGTPGTAESNHP